MTMHVRDLLFEECHRRELKLFELDSVVPPVGKQAMLYCGACETVIPCGKVVAGPIQDWPYCPVHQDKALMVCSVLI